MKKSVFSKFESLEIVDRDLIKGGAQTADTGVTQNIEICYGPSGLDNFADAQYTDSSSPDWDDKDACAAEAGSASVGG